MSNDVMLCLKPFCVSQHILFVHYGVCLLHVMVTSWRKRDYALNFHYFTRKG